MPCLLPASPRKHRTSWAGQGFKERDDTVAVQTGKGPG